MWEWMVKRAVGLFSGLSGAGRRMMDGVYGSRRGEPPVRGTREFLEAYGASPWIRAVLGRISTSVGSTQWTLEGRGGRRVPEDHIMLRTLRAPNPTMSGHDLMKVTQLYLDIVGDSFWYKVRNGLGAPVQLWPIPPHWVVETPTPGNPFYRVSQFQWQEIIPDTEVHWIRDVDPLNPYGRGAGFVRAMTDEIETHEFASKHAKQIFFNRATPEVVIMDPGAQDPEITAHERAFTSRLQGFWRWYKPYFTNRKLEFWQPQQMNLENLTMVPLMKFERDVILQVTGMPPEQLGIVENSNRATAEAGDFVYEQRVVKPRRESLRDALQRFAPEYDERIVVGFVDTTPSDKEHRLNVAKAAPFALTLDEWRAEIGMPAVGGELGKSRMISLAGYATVDPLDQEQRPKSGAGTEGKEKEEVPA